MSATQSASTTLVLVPGLLLTGAMWTEQVAALQTLGRVHVTEQHRHHDDIARMADAILGEVDGPLAVCGLSMGGYIALELCRRAPQRVARLALLSTGAQPESPQQTSTRDELIALGRAQGIHAVVDALWPRLVHPSHSADTVLRQSQYDMAEVTGQTVFEQEQAAIKARPDQRPHLAAIRCPTLIICGCEDQVTPHELSQELHAGIAGSKLLSLPGCGHLSAMEQAEPVNQALMRWWLALNRPA